MNALSRAISSGLCTLALAVSLASSAQGDARADLVRAEASFRAGAAAYAAGDYPAAIQALDAAYAMTPLPAIAFSLAQAERRQYFAEHERPHLERAIALFRSYIGLVTSGGRRDDALDALSQLEPLLASMAASETSASPPSQLARTRVMITTSVPEAEITLDDAPFAPSPLIREVSAGKHHARIEADGYYPVERDVTALLGELILTEVKLEARPSEIVVSCPSDAELYVDGVFASEGGPQIMLHVTAGEHHLAVAARGRRIAERKLTLERGKSVQVDFTLEATSQRKIARALFLAGGVGFGASIVVGILTLSAQGRAQDFLAKQESEPVSTGELDRYHDDRDRRDRLRIATGATVATAASLFVTGLFLHQLDRPNPREIHRRAHLGEPASAGALAKLTCAPWFARGSAGVSGQLRF